MNAEPIGRNGRRLKTWKEIAAFFGCDERTVRRWEESFGLPVRRVPNSPRSAVFAYEDELRSWLNEERSGGPHPDSLQSGAGRRNKLLSAVGKVPPRWLIAMLVVMAVALATVWFVFAGSRGTRQHEPNAEAEKFYRAGLYGWQSRTPAGLTGAVDDFTQAIVHDPQYAKAYAGLADCYNLLREYTAMPPDYAFARAKAAAERAIALDPSLPDAHAALAFVDFYWSHDAVTARREFERALALAPGNATVHHWYATFLMNLRQFPQALDEIDRAQQIDSASISVLADRGMILFHAGKANEATSLLRKLEETEPQFSSPHRYLAMIYRAAGDDADFVRELSSSAETRRHAADAEIAAAAARGLMQAGHQGMLIAMLQIQRRLFSELESPAYALAQTCADLGRDGQAIQYLSLSLKRHEPDAVSLNVDIGFRRLRSARPFLNLVRQSGVEAAAARS